VGARASDHSALRLAERARIPRSGVAAAAALTRCGNRQSLQRTNDHDMNGQISVTGCLSVSFSYIRNDGQRQGEAVASRIRAWRPKAVRARTLAALWSVCLLVLLAACGSAPPQAKPVAHSSGVPAGFTEFRDSGRGYTIAIPASWIQVNVQSANAAAKFNQLLKEKPQFAKVFGNNLAALAKQRMSLLAVAPTGTSVNMIVQPGSGTMTATQLATAYSADLRPAYSRLGFKVLGHQMAKLDGYPALRVAITVTFGTVVRGETQFIAGVHGKVFILTIARAKPSLTDQIADTVRFF
jgi:hypothetical protein